jgi:hypothetical protein
MNLLTGGVMEDHGDTAVFFTSQTTTYIKIVAWLLLLVLGPVVVLEALLAYFS